MAGTTSPGMTEAALAAGVDHWVGQGIIRYLYSRGTSSPVTVKDIAQAVGCSRSLALKHANGLCGLKLVRVEGKQGGSHLFALTPDGKALAEMVWVEAGEFRPIRTSGGNYAPGKPRPEPKVDHGGRAQLGETMTAKAETNGHKVTLLDMLDAMTLAEVRAMLEGSDEGERVGLRAIIMKRAGLQ